MQTYILIDSLNLFHRQANMTSDAYGIDSMIGMCFHMLLTSMKKEYNQWGGTHAVMFLDDTSWRKNIYPEYKANRKVSYNLMAPKEKEKQKILSEAFSDFIQYIDEHTNISVVKAKSAEADDLIAMWVESHPTDRHVLITSDSDFIQLLRNDNFTIYDPIKNVTIKKEGVFNENNKKMSFTFTSDAKLKVGKEDPDFAPENNWYEYALFMKCIRGDKGDNIFSAYPGIRENGTKKSIGIKEAYSDIENKGYSWNNFMNQRWIDHNNVENKVKDKYEFNKTLIDLSMIPDEVKLTCIEAMQKSVNKPSVPAIDIGMSFMKFCGKWELKRIGDSSKEFMPMLKSKYSSILLEENNNV